MREPSVELDRLTHEVIGAAIEVHKELGPGFLESVYEEALCVELELRRIPFIRQHPVAVLYKDHGVGEGRLDLLVDNALIVEFKAVEAIAAIHTAQVISYLKATGCKLGLLINFNTDVLGVLAVNIMRTIFLLDIDCFFASVEMALHPELRGKPLCIGGPRGSRGIVACPNYEARAYGVKTAMPLRTAEKLLPPDAVFMPGSHKLYGEYSERVMDLLYDFTPDIEQVSVDEAYMDVTGCLHFWNHDPVRMAQSMQDRIWNDCGLSVSIGIASNKVCAKIAAGLRKPKGIVHVPHGWEKDFLAPLPVEMIPGIGVKTTPKLHALGIRTVADILAPNSVLRDETSWLAHYLTALASGRDEQVMQYDRVEKSISRDTTFWHDTNIPEFIESTLYYLAERCCKALRERNQVAATVTTKVRFSDFTTLQKQFTLSLPTANEEDIFGSARRMLHVLLPPHRMIRLVGVKVSHLSDVHEAQLQLGITKEEKRAGLHQRLDALQEKFGYTSIQWGIAYALQKQFESSKEGYRLHSPVYEM